MSVITATRTAASVPGPGSGPYDGADERDRLDRRAARRRPAGGARPARRRADRARAVPGPPAEAGAGRLQLQRGDAAGGAAGRKPARRRRHASAPSSSASSAAEGSVERIEVAGPGFVNLFLADAWYRRAMARLGAAGESLGPAPDSTRPSASWSSSSPPTRPGRCTSAAAATPPTATPWSACWRRSATRSSASSTSTTRGGQVERFAASIAAAMTRRRAARGRLRGRLRRRAGRALDGRGDRPGRHRGGRPARGRADPRGRARHARPLRRPLRQLVLRARPLRAAARSRRRWRSSSSAATPTGARGRSGCARTDFGDDKDRVLIRANGEPTYLAADVAYHWDKLERGFGRLIDVLGADHHGYAPRLRAAIAAPRRRPRRASRR